MNYIKLGKNDRNVNQLIVSMGGSRRRILSFEGGFFAPKTSYLSKSPGSKTMIKDQQEKPKVVIL